MTGKHSISSSTADPAMQQALASPAAPGSADGQAVAVPQLTLHLDTGGVLTVGVGIEFSTSVAASSVPIGTRYRPMQAASP